MKRLIMYFYFKLVNVAYTYAIVLTNQMYICIYIIYSHFKLANVAYAIVRKSKCLYVCMLIIMYFLFKLVNMVYMLYSARKANIRILCIYSVFQLIVSLGCCLINLNAISLILTRQLLEIQATVRAAFTRLCHQYKFISTLTIKEIQKSILSIASHTYINKFV